ncbi:Cof-type HAD-IIB family hydrolase [Yersinia enterocolitica]|uniref:Cof-type HAD-IIB family hydrolase n=1 Tax=Yersinia enterocolitica TaxID=630 RepID=UPI002AC42830|nr:HAD family phosphatase [Yersinia enterocolitica]HDL7015200.1 HAD family phosphatase [Yersinia enterocolitica]HDL7087686.1 HAD family phosphatase [Yersinia enterocolitica]HDL7342614.1 HAD family phosphatase [Yersinia enterocolitica]HDM8092702.1 HAD family phosphatase [Yersinia enterocolitica]
MYKLLALDLDGTLLNQENQISAQNINAVKRVIHQHGTVVLCSARPVRAIAAVIRNTELEYLIRYFISFNGAWIYDAVEKKDIRFMPLRRPDVKNVITMLAENEFKHHFFTRDNMISSLKDISVHTRYESQLFAMELAFVEPKDIIQRDDIVKVSIVGSTDFIDNIANKIDERFHRQYSLSKTSCHYYEIMRQGITKGEALHYLSRHLNIGSQSVVSMGDQENDISMFQFSAVGVAMGNASDFVKSCADKVSQDNNHHGVAFAINQLWPL